MAIEHGSAESKTDRNLLISRGLGVRAHINEQPPVIVLVVGHEGVIADGSSKAQNDGDNDLKECQFGLLPWLDGLSEQHHRNCNCWDQVTEYIPCAAAENALRCRLFIIWAPAAQALKA